MAIFDGWLILRENNCPFYVLDKSVVLGAERP